MNRVGNFSKAFTIVELLIVIVVIAILAAITIVAFNGIQTRAENAKTVSAVAAWAKALQAYKVDKGTFPPMNSCLGSTTTYQSSYNGRCWAPNTSSWVVQQSFLNEIAPYMRNPAEPSSRNINSDSEQYRGALYMFSANGQAGDDRIYVNILGDNPCPVISGLQPSYQTAARSDGKGCYYRFS